MPPIKILIAGSPESGQKDIVEKLTGAPLASQDLAGFVLDHKFITRYFTVDCGIWTDEFVDSSEWASEFCSPEAEEVVDAIVLFIFTFDVGDPKVAGLGRFVDMLRTSGTSLAVPRAGVELSADKFNELSDMGFDIISIDEIEPVVHTTLYDAINEGSESDGGEEPAVAGPPREIEDIIEELQRARSSTSMTKEEKMALAEKLADELL